MNEYRDESIGSAIRDLPTPAPPEGFHAWLESAFAPEARERLPLPRLKRRGVRRAFSRRLVLAVGVVAAALVVGGVAGSVLASPSKASTTPVPAFQPTLGWNTFEANVGDAPLPVAYAANVAFQAPDTSGPDIPPTATLQNLPSDGIVIAVGGPSPYTGSDSPSQLQFPLELSQMYFSGPAPYEGSVAANVSEYRISGLVSGSDGSQETVEIFVWMGTNNPTQHMIDAANAELAQLQMPS